MNDQNVDNSNYKLQNYSSIHQIRSHSRGGGVSIYIHKDFEFKIRNDLSINCKDVESLGVELLHDKKKNALFNVLYRPPNGQIETFETFETFLRHLFHENKNSNKNFHICINDLNEASSILNLIMFADDTNLFYSYKNIENLFFTMNNELVKINEWFKANKLSLNIKKTKFTLFHKKSLTKSRSTLPLAIPNLQIGNKNIERVSSIKFLGIMLDEHLSWKDHIKIVENKLAKNIGLLYRVHQYLNQSSLKTVYFSYIHSYLNHANVAWASTYPTNLKRIHLKQKQK